MSFFSSTGDKKKTAPKMNNESNFFSVRLSHLLLLLLLLLLLHCSTLFAAVLCPHQHIPVLPVCSVIERLTVSQPTYH